MRVLVTGGAGFLGTHVAEHFTRLGNEVSVIDNLTTDELERTTYDTAEARRHNLEHLERLGCNFLYGDIRLPINLHMQGVDLVAHCAAQPAMTLSIESPLLDLQTNIRGTYNVLEAARRADAAVVNCSSIHVYGNDINKNLEELETRFTNTPDAFTEEQPTLQTEHLTPLHASKVAAELYTRVFAETYGLRAATFRLTGMYGERQFGGMDHGWVANFAIRTVMEQPITLFGTGKQVRDILYAGDAARAFSAWYERGKSTTYNIGGGRGNAISLQECLRLIALESDVEQDIHVAPPRDMDLWYFVCDVEKARRDFGWVPTTTNREGIKKIVHWVKENTRLFKSRPE